MFNPDRIPIFLVRKMTSLAVGELKYAEFDRKKYLIWDDLGLAGKVVAIELFHSFIWVQELHAARTLFRWGRFTLSLSADDVSSVVKLKNTASLHM